MESGLRDQCLLYKMQDFPPVYCLKYRYRMNSLDLYSCAPKLVKIQCINITQKLLVPSRIVGKQSWSLKTCDVVIIADLANLQLFKKYYIFFIDIEIYFIDFEIIRKI